ncbi:MAG: DNA repair protein RecN [Candidatus Eisenbacteria bacterium]|uniref:DNA repair protein RecN n=1 Tax=Eiseniibacteriota bacterium TaxID=2212470 RepID=A0A538TQ90_UNCEI|nr:MAG: DNA repair protein RecN [Candidatus Eisenbacteria bacterium]
MLTWLSIQGLALVDRIELSFDPALNVLTGETGAGKSLILGSIALLLGERADPDWLRAGEDRGFVEGSFDLSGRPDLLLAVRALEVELEEDRVIVRRELTGDGKNRALVNGRTVLISQLRKLGDLLVDLHGQHEHQLLLRAESQADFYDAWAGVFEERSALEVERGTIVEEGRALREARAAWDRDRADEERLREDLAELTRASLEPDEEEKLKEERERLRHRERIVESLRAARQSLAAEEGAAEGLVRRAARTLRSLASTAPDQGALADQAESLLDSLRELTGKIEDAEARALEEPLPLEQLETRLDLIHRLKRKHRSEFAGLLAIRDSLLHRFRASDPSGQGLDPREAALKRRMAEFGKGVDGLVDKRRAEATRFEREVSARLQKLGFQKASLSVAFVESDEARDRPAIDPAAIPGLEFHFRPNAGEPTRSLRRIASGGELSRVMLAVKSLMAERDRVAVLVFDEVDQGIGGAVGEEVGRLLRALASRRQVLCITHLPLIAAHGTRHFEVIKSTARGRTTTGVRMLTGKDREEEISRLLAGARVTETTRRQARELLLAARDPADDAPPRARRTASRGA